MKKILFALEGINCTGGGHVASRNLIARLLQDHYEVGILSDDNPIPEIVSLLNGAVFYLGCDIPYHSFKWLLTGLFRKIMHSRVYPSWMIDPMRCTRKIMQCYDVIVVCGETSLYRELVSRLPSKIYKVQHIHTNYHEWNCRDSWARFFVQKDHIIYSKYDAIALIGEKNAISFAKLFPEIQQKVSSFKNILNLPSKCVRDIEVGKTMHLITLARIDDLASKDGFRMVRVAKKLRDLGCKFVWDIYGGGKGEIYDRIVLMIKDAGIGECFRLHGHVTNVQEKFEGADLFVLLSHYEGLPNVIYESLSAGVPVFATNVGCIEEQIDNGKNGWLVDDKEEIIIDQLQKILLSPQSVVFAKRMLKKYYYDNDFIYQTHKTLMKI